MLNRMGLEMLVLATLGHCYMLVEQSIGDEAHLTKSGVEFWSKAWTVEGIGHLYSLKTRTRFGLMKTETVVIAPTQVDAPLVNFDWMKTPDGEIQLAELYDDQLQPWPAEYQAEFQAIRDRYADLADIEFAENPYDAVLYPCSCHKQGKGISGRLSRLAQDYTATYTGYLHVAPQLDRSSIATKTAKVRAFAEQLVTKGGLASRPTTGL